jgi:hypothetical protein
VGRAENRVFGLQMARHSYLCRTETVRLQGSCVEWFRGFARQVPDLRKLSADFYYRHRHTPRYVCTKDENLIGGSSNSGDF